MALAIDHFSRTYQATSGTFTAVDDLSFAVAAGEIVGLIGPNGAGKTTTLRSIAGILRPTSGVVRIDGHDIVADPIEAKRRLAFIPHGPHPLEEVGPRVITVARGGKRADGAFEEVATRAAPGAAGSTLEQFFSRVTGHGACPADDRREPLHRRVQRAQPAAAAAAAAARAAL